jgi:hypothetical protein
MTDLSQEAPTDDYDSPWKDVIEHFFPQLLEMFLPVAYEDIDWARGWESRDTELRQIVREAELGPRVADKLIAVFRKNGSESRVFVHVEVQSQRDSDFAQRIYVYNYRIFDRFGGDVVSLGVLADDSPRWCPDAYERSLWGCRTGIEFPVAKLLNYRNRWDELERSTNPFALITMAHLKTQETRNAPASRLRWKIDLVKWLYGRGYSRLDVIDLLRVLDWLMTLPSDLAIQFEHAVEELETNMGKPYVTSWERRWQEQDRQEGTVLGMRHALTVIGEKRFGALNPDIKADIDAISDLTVLQHLLNRVLEVESWAELLAPE